MPLNTFRKKGREVYELTLFYIDHSFNYRDGLGQTSTDDMRPQGFEFSLDGEDIIIPKSVEGFGIFDDIDTCKTYATLYAYLVDLILNIEAGEYDKALNPYEDIKHWIPFLKQLKDGCFSQLRIRNAA